MKRYIMRKSDVEQLNIKDWLENNLRPSDYTLTVFSDPYDDRQLAQIDSLIARLREDGRDTSVLEAKRAANLAGRDDRPLLIFHDDVAAVHFKLSFDDGLTIVAGDE